jgi:hypothetical protein
VIIFDSHAQHLLHHVQHVAAFREAGDASPVHAPGLRRQALPL